MSEKPMSSARMTTMFGIAAPAPMANRIALLSSANSLTRGLRCTLAHLRRREAFAVLPRENLFVGFVVVGEAEIGGVPTQFLAGITRRFHGQQGRFGDAPADVERRPQRFLCAKAIVRPVFPVVARLHFGQR